MSSSSATSTLAAPTWFERNSFLLRRLHSLTGVVPVGLFITFHLLANATVLQGLSVYQFMVEQINSLGPLVPVLSFTLILLPILFHAFLGIVYTFTAKSNVSMYGYSANWRYLLQRVTGVILLFFIFWHVLTLKFGYLTPFVHAETIGGDNIAATSTGLALRWNWFITVFYVVGVASAVYHWVNGIWTFLITWGVTIGEKAQRKVAVICALVGIFLGLLSLSAVVKFVTLPVPDGANMQLMRELRLKQDAKGVTSDE